MPPQERDSMPLIETVAKTTDSAIESSGSLNEKTKREIRIAWEGILTLSFLHIGSVYGLYLLIFKVMWTTRLFAFFLHICSCLGISAAAHRYWAHKSFKARLPLRLILITLNTLAFQGPALSWARDHRMHHKYSETDADPQNATRGFFFSHVGWVMVRKHPDVLAKAHTIETNDLHSDPLLVFQKKHYWPLGLLLCFILPSYIPTFWGESLWNAYFVCGILRQVASLNSTFLVNSVAHRYGNKPYDKNIHPVENKAVSLLILGEGFHNFHHTFPWDYKTAELGNYALNFSKLFLDVMAKIGWAYDLKTVSNEVIEKRVKRTGDGSHPVWGWDDKDLPPEEKREAIVINPDKCM